MVAASSLRNAIQNLSSKKDVVSEDAIQAKTELDAYRETGDYSGDGSKISAKKLSTIDEFNKSIKLLTAIFQESNFDELASMISNPTRVLILNFLIGILRGIGFGIGVLFILSFLLFLLKNSLSHEFSYYLVNFLREIKL